MPTANSYLIKFRASDSYGKAIDALIEQLKRPEIANQHDLARVAIAEYARRRGVELPPTAAPTGRPRRTKPD